MLSPSFSYRGITSNVRWGSFWPAPGPMLFMMLKPVGFSACDNSIVTLLIALIKSSSSSPFSECKYAWWFFGITIACPLVAGLMFSTATACLPS